MIVLRQMREWIESNELLVFGIILAAYTVAIVVAVHKHRRK
jgi:hypothetical protein